MRVSLQSFVALVVITGLIVNVWVMLRTPDHVNLSNENKFYIYDWPKEVSDSWPETCSHHRISIHSHFRLNYGAGQEIDRAHGMYYTHQYALYEIFYQRLLVSPLRTLNPAEATLFFIPYDLGMDATTRYSDGALAQTNCPRMNQAMNLLRNSPYFQHSEGSNHFMVHSINQMMVFYANDKCASIYELCKNCSKLSIDTYPAGMYSHLDKRSHLSHYWISIPFPSNYHHSENVSAPLWKAISLVPGYMNGPYQTQRPFAVCFAGSTTVTAKLQKQLRIELISICKTLPGICLHVPLPTHQSHESIFNSSAATLGVNDVTSSYGQRSNEFAVNKIIHPYALAKFCLTPGGDFPTRKGFFDAMLSGCVPVIFERTSALTQWPLHWHGTSKMSENSVKHNLASECTVYLPREVAMRNMSDAFTYLVKLSQDTLFMQRRLECIAAVGMRMQYSIPEVKNADHGNNREIDAFDVVLEHLLQTSKSKKMPLLTHKTS